MVMLRCRSKDHITNLAISEISKLRYTSKMRAWYRECMNIFNTLDCQSILSDNLHTFTLAQQCNYRKVVGKRLQRALKSRWAQEWVSCQSATCKLSPQLLTLTAGNQYGKLEVICTPMHMYDGATSYIYTYTQWLGWVESGAYNANHSYISPLCREALLLFRTGVAPQFIKEVDWQRNTDATTRFDRICDYCKYIYNRPILHDAFHVMFECPLFESDRKTLFERLPAQLMNECYKVNHSLITVHVLLLSPPKIQVAAAVGYFLACAIAKLGMFNSLKDSYRDAGPAHFMHDTVAVREYKGKWTEIYCSKLNDIRMDVINLFNQPRNNRWLYDISPSVVQWASQCNLHVVRAYSLGLMLPSIHPAEWKNMVTQSLPVNNQVRLHLEVLPKAKAKPKVCPRICFIGKVPQ